MYNFIENNLGLIIFTISILTVLGVYSYFLFSITIRGEYFHPMDFFTVTSSTVSLLGLILSSYFGGIAVLISLLVGVPIVGVISIVLKVKEVY